MSRSTSIDVYREIESEGLLSKMRFEVYSTLYRIGPATAGEMAADLVKNGSPSGGGRAGPGNVSARLVELRDLGVAKEIGERTCKITDRNVIEWDVTDQLPAGQIENRGVPRPKPEVMKTALDEIRLLIRSHSVQNKDYKPSPSLIALGKWLKDRFER